MRYSLQIKRSAQKELEKIIKPDRQRLIEAIDQLAENPHIGKRLKGEFAGLHRVRVGTYRIIYEVNEGQVLILFLRVAHRKQSYRHQ